MIGQFGQDVHFIAVDERNVGAARAACSSVTQSQCLRLSASDTGTQRRTPTLRWAAIGWYGNSAVGLTWCWVWRWVGQWRHHSEQVAELYEARYHADAPLHQHIHGAEHGISVPGVLACRWLRGSGQWGRCRPGRSLRAADLHIAWDDQLWVTTSDRQRGRAPDGFADHLAEVSQEVERHGDRADEVS